MSAANLTGDSLAFALRCEKECEMCSKTRSILFLKRKDVEELLNLVLWVSTQTLARKLDGKRPTSPHFVH